MGDGVDVSIFNPQAPPAFDYQAALSDDIKYFVRHRYFQLTMNLTTLFVLFGEGIRQSITASSVIHPLDQVFLAFTTIAFVFFTTELCLQCYAIKGYFSWPNRREEGISRWAQLKSGDLPRGSFFFWLDFISTFSLIFELTWLLREFGGGRYLLQGGQVIDVDLGDVAAVPFLFNSEAYHDDASASASAQQASQTSRAGARAGRIVRIVKAFSLLRIQKLFSSTNDDAVSEEKHKDSIVVRRRQSSLLLVRQAASKVSPELTTPTTRSAVRIDSHLDHGKHDSNVGKSMSELTQQRLIVGVIAIVICLPLLQSSSKNNAAMFSTRLAHSFWYKSVLCGVSPSCSLPLHRGLLSANERVRSKEHKTGKLLMKFEQSVQFGGASQIYTCDQTLNTTICQNRTLIDYQGMRSFHRQK